MNVERPTHLDLFSGIGGFALAAKWAGFKTIAFCERDPYAKRVLAKNFPGVPTFDDVFDLDGKKFRGTDVLSGGFPCQPYSQAGKRRGSEDDRAIWPEMARIISEARPKWILGENVLGLVSMGLDQVLSDLERLDYSCEALVVPACAVDAHHRRDRVWIVASDSSRLGHRGRTNEKCRNASRPVLSSEQERGEMGSEAEGRNQLFRERKIWRSQSGLCRVAHGIPDRMDRLKGLGNAIVPQVAFEFFRVMKGVM